MLSYEWLDTWNVIGLTCLRATLKPDLIDIVKLQLKLQIKLGTAHELSFLIETTHADFVTI